MTVVVSVVLAPVPISVTTIFIGPKPNCGLTVNSIPTAPTESLFT